MLPSILFAIPCYGGIIYDKCVSGIYSTAQKLASIGYESNLLLVANESLISIGRSNIANRFINDTKYEYLMCIDADVGFKWRDIELMINSKKPFVTGAYSMKIIPPRYNFRVSSPVTWENNLLEIDFIGAGFQLIHRSVFETIGKNYPELKYSPSSTDVSQKMKNNSFHFYETMLENGSLLSEDFSFCTRYRKCGGHVWLNTDVKLSHTGSYVFEGHDNLGQILREGVR